MRQITVLGILCAFALTPCAAFAQEPVRVPELPSAPAVDGMWDEVYAQGAQLVDFWDFSSSIVSAVPAEKPMRAWFGHRERVLYVFCENAEPEPENIRTKVTFHDGPVWTDDCVELFIDPLGDRKSHFQFVLSAAGIKADIYNGNVAWNPKYEAAAKVFSASWSGEWGIAFEALGITALEDIYADKHWTFNLYREDKVSAAYSTWVPVNSAIVKTFSTRSVFAEMRIVSDGEPGVYTLEGTPLRPSGKESEEIVWRTEDPLYEELLTTESRQIPNQTGMFWTHPLNGGLVRPTAVQYGVEYSLEDTANVFKRLDFYPIMQGNTIQRLIEEPAYPRAQFMYMANSHYARAAGVPQTPEGYTILFIPENVNAYFQQAEEVLSKYRDDIWGVFAGDEIVNHQTNVLIGGLTRYDENLTPYLEKIDRDVKDRFGMGTYGLPESDSDEEAYRWLATNSWVDEQTCLLIEGLRKVVDRVAPEVKVMSDDPIAGFHPFDFAWRGKYCDILTHQTYPARTPLRQECAFIAKLLVDQSNKSVWPCVHAEHYGASYTPEQTAEVYSQVFRCGAEGIHYYPQDVVGVRRKLLHTHYCGLGAPDRWATMLSVFQKVHHLPKLNMPETTCVGVLVEPSTSRAISRAKSRTRDEYETCFDLLGPHARSWFRFIHAGQLERAEVNLTDYKAIYLPTSRFFHPKRVDDMLSYCRDGGAVISTDPEIWTYSATQAYAPIPQLGTLGITHKGDWREFEKMTISDNQLFPALAVGTEIGFPTKVKSRQYELDKSWQTLASFEDGVPAIVTKEHGAGVWVQFAFQPFEETHLRNDGIRELFKAMQQHFGEKTDLDIWRFTFPAAESPKAPEGTCLTGNAIHWQQNIPKHIGGDGVDGMLSWTLKPQGADSDSEQFADCRLFDRRKGIAAKNDERLKESLEHWSCVWSNTEEFQLTLSWDQKTDLNRLRIWYSGQMPQATIWTSAGNGELWNSAGQVPARDAKTDVYLFDTSLQAQNATALRIQFAERPKGSLMLHEMEIWSP